MFKKGKALISKKVVVKDEPNPWKKIEHDCDWLSANDGKELVCGLCGDRKAV